MLALGIIILLYFMVSKTNKDYEAWAYCFGCGVLLFLLFSNLVTIFT